MTVACSKQATKEHDGCSIRDLWNSTLVHSYSPYPSHTKPRCLSAVFARIRRTRGRSALCATKSATLRATAPTDQVLLRLLRLQLLHPQFRLLLHRHLQQDPMRAPLPLQSLRLLLAHGSTNWWLTLSILGLLSLILRLHHSDQGPLRQILRLQHPFDRPLQLWPLIPRPRLPVPRQFVQVLRLGHRTLRQLFRALQLKVPARSMLISHQSVSSFPKSRSLGTPSSKSMSSVSALDSARLARYC